VAGQVEAMVLTHLSAVTTTTTTTTDQLQSVDGRPPSKTDVICHSRSLQVVVVGALLLLTAICTAAAAAAAAAV